MNEIDLRALVRDAVERHLGQGEAAPEAAARRTLSSPAGHASHGLFLTLVNVGDDCLIEPSVRCNHCGYCKTHGY
jgi:hypothetical protein